MLEGAEKMKTLFAIVAALFAGGCAGHAASQASTEAPPGEVWLTPQQVKDAHLEMETVGDRPVGGIVRAAGRVTFDDLRVAHVFSPVTGRITKILAQPGERVKKGQPLCVIQSPDLGSAVSDMAKAQATLFQAEKDWKRQKDLYEVHAAAQRDYEAAESAYMNAKAEMERAQRKARLLRSSGLNTVTQEYMLPAPIEGEVIARTANLGLEITGQYSQGANLEVFTIGELDRVWVLADVFEMDLPKIKKGAEVNVRVLAYPEERFSGHVEWISGALDPVSRTAKIRCSIANAEGKLRPEMFGTALISVNADTKLAIKRQSILLMGEQPVVFVQIGMTPKGELRFVRRPVAVDEMEGGDYVPLKSGVQRNENVVVSGGVLLLGML
jgi:cobalt-zinc-cadmium efflux system membrane fusion protein